MKMRLLMQGGAAVQVGGTRFFVREFGRRYAEAHPGAEIRCELWRRVGDGEPALMEEAFQRGSLEPGWSGEYEVAE